jgi:hypothetical protein
MEPSRSNIYADYINSALSPTSPFPKQFPRLKLAGLLLPALLVSSLTTSYMFMKVNTFIVGFTFFGDPIISRGLVFLNEKFPNWQKLLKLQK